MISTNLRRLREYKNYSQDYMAEQLGIKQNTYSRYETGEVVPKLEVLKRAAQVLGVPEPILLYGEPVVLTQNNHDHASGSSGYVIHQHITNDVVDKLLKQYEERVRNLEAQNQRLMEMLDRYLTKTTAATKS